MRGELPPEIDKDGNLVNPHIPEFMAKAPWYLTQQTGLAHQRLSKGAAADQSLLGMESYYRRGQTLGAATKYRKGACKNCGAMTHKATECVERPRKIGAWKTNADIRPDEVVMEDVSLGWDAKRDRYAGYDAREHVSTVELYNAAEEERRKIREEERRKKQETKEARRKEKEEKRAAQAAAGDAGDDASTASEWSDASSDEDDSDDEGARESGAKKMTSWNVRTREDTAKYLLNLDVDSAFYDPKTRSMRENPLEGAPDKPGKVMVAFQGDNAWRRTGGAVDLEQDEIFAWEAQNQGLTDVHLQANPTATALLKKQIEERKKKVAEALTRNLQATYAPDTTFTAYGKDSDSLMPPELRVGATESLTLFAPDGTRLRSDADGAAKRDANVPASAAKSTLYEEDVYPGNHKSVWGSWFDRDEMTWGYACCQSTLYNSYCTGEAGKKAKKEAAEYAMGSRNGAGNGGGGNGAGNGAGVKRDRDRE